MDNLNLKNKISWRGEKEEMVFEVEETYIRANAQMCGTVWCAGTRPGARKRSGGHEEGEQNPRPEGPQTQTDPFSGRWEKSQIAKPWRMEELLGFLKWTNVHLTCRKKK